jgi:hypothetical protein
VALAGVTLLGGAGCVAHAQAGASAGADAPVVFTSEPTLVEVESGVWVVRDSDQPVYFVGDEYWVVRDGVWYRAHSYDEGWVRVEVNVVPAVIVHRDHRMYVRYHGAATAQTRPAPRRHGGDHHGPPEHAAEAKGGPPGQDPGHDHHGDDHHDRAEDHDGHHDHDDRQDADHGKKRDDKKDDKKDDRKDDKKDDKRHRHH